jgi:hypothetical protein
VAAVIAAVATIPPAVQAVLTIKDRAEQKKREALQREVLMELKSRVAARRDREARAEALDVARRA